MYGRALIFPIPDDTEVVPPQSFSYSYSFRQRWPPFSATLCRTGFRG
jgi:hypothetical protein